MNTIYCHTTSAAQIAAGTVTLLAGFAMMVASMIARKTQNRQMNKFPAMGVILGTCFIAVGIVHIWFFPIWQRPIHANQFPIWETTIASLLAMMYMCATLTMFNSRLLRYDIIIGNLIVIMFFPIIWRIDQLTEHENKAINAVFYIYFLIQTVAYIIVYTRESQKFLDTMNGYFEQTDKQKYKTTETNIVFSSWTLLSLWWAIAKLIPILDKPKAFVITQSIIVVVTTMVFILHIKKNHKIAEVRNCLEQSQ